MKKVYLAGPITGLTYEGCTNWREHAQKVLKPAGITALSPMRGKAFLQNMGELRGCRGYDELGVLAGQRGIMTRDRWDATRCDVLLVNLLGADRVSIGTVMEIAWADLCRTPIVCAMEPAGNIHEHMMVNEAIGYRLPSLDDALDIVKAVLGDQADAAA